MGRCIILGQPPSSHNSVRKSIKKITWPQTACASALACLDNMMSLRIDVFNKCILRNVQGPCIFHFLYPKGRYKATKPSKIFPTLRAAKIQGHSILRHLILGHLTLLHLVLSVLHLILRPNYDLRKLWPPKTPYYVLFVFLINLECLQWWRIRVVGGGRKAR